MTRSRDIADSTKTLDVDGGTIKLDGNYPVGTANVALGDTALDDGSLSGGYNTAVGAGSLSANTSGQQNASFGAYSLDTNTTGSYNAGFGQSSLGSNTTGSYNTSLGRGTLSSNTTASGNSAVGYNALTANTTGEFNTGLGREALEANTTANDNTAVGFRALTSNTTGATNVAVGRDALLSNTTASNNTAVGFQAGYSTNNSSATFNTIFGYQAGYSNTSGSTNTFIGPYSGYSMTTGSNNTIIGRYNGNQGGLDIRTSSNRIVLSDGSGNPRVYIDNNGAFKAANYSNISNISTTSFHQFIGSGANSYELTIGNWNSNPQSQYITDISFKSASPDNSAAKYIQMRDSTTVRVNINSDGDIYNHDGTYGTISDERIKQDIVDASSQWEDIKNIRVRKYKKKHDVIQYGAENTPLELGVISQELETVSPGLVKEDKADSSHAELHEDFTGDTPQNVKYVKYSILYMKSIKALQEAMARIETLEVKNDELEARITALEA